MTAEEKAALEWLRVAFAAEGTSRCHWFPDANDMKQAATLKAMLAQPRLPEEPSEEAIRAMLAGGGWTPEGGDHMRESYRALYTHLTKPKTKTVWHVMEAQDGGRRPEHFDYDSLEDALGRVRVCAERHRITVTIEPREVPT